MEFKGFEEKAETPELGGIFGNLILILKPDLGMDRKKRATKYSELKYDSETKKNILVYNVAELQKDYLPFLADHIVGWRNMTKDGKEEKFTENWRNHFFFNLKDEKTGHELELPKPKKHPDDKDETETRTATLEEYTNWFISKIENFTKN